MKKIIQIMVVLVASVVVFSPLASAQRPLPEPGITPDSPFYFVETFVDRFRSPERVADRKAAEMIAMAEKNNAEALSRAEEHYNRAMDRLEERAGDDANMNEERVRQASNHMAHLANVSERVPEEAKEGIQKAMENSARRRERGIEAINRTDPQRAGSVAENTLQELIGNTPEQARQGLETALENVRRERDTERIGPEPNVTERGPDGKIPDSPGEEENGEAEEGNGAPENLTDGAGGENGQDNQPPL